VKAKLLVGMTTLAIIGSFLGQMVAGYCPVP
jgi:hypothetical protein